MSFGVALQAVVTGLAQGAVYGLVALGFTLCYRLVRVLNFAHGDVIVAAVFAGVLATAGTTPVVRTPTLAAAAVQVVVSLGAGALVGAVLYLVAVRPFTGARPRPFGWVAATIAAGLVVREVLALVFPREAYSVADPLRLPEGLLGLPGGGAVPVRLVGVLAVGLVAGVLVDQYVVRSRTGRAMRAVADDRDTAALMGIPRDRVVLLAFLLAGTLAGLAGLLAAPGQPVSVGDGVTLGLKGVAAALLGRLGSPRGALAGGLLLGVAEGLAVTSALLGAAYRDAFALLVLVVVLAVRPEGLGSRRERTVE